MPFQQLYGRQLNTALVHFTRRSSNNTTSTFNTALVHFTLRSSNNTTSTFDQTYDALYDVSCMLKLTTAVVRERRTASKFFTINYSTSQQFECVFRAHQGYSCPCSQLASPKHGKFGSAQTRHGPLPTGPGLARPVTPCLIVLANHVFNC